MRGLIFFSIALVLPCLADAVIYKCVDNSGEVIFSDRPCPGAEEIEIRIDPAPKPPPPPPGLADLRRKPDTPPAATYETITITQPANDESIRANDGSFPVSVSLQPALRVSQGHKLVLTLDGKVVGEPAGSTQFRLTDVNRGTHTVSAKVVGAGGKEIVASAPVTFHVLRVSLFLPPANPGGNFPAPNFPIQGPGNAPVPPNP